MSRLLYKEDLEIKDSKSIISFDTKGGGSWEVWNRFISIDGKPAYEIGNICGTCSFYFKRLDGANQSIHPKSLIDELNEGFEEINKEVIEKISEIIPDGKYKVLFLKIYPKHIELGTKKDYFANESIELWGIDSFWDMPHNPRIKYYRGTDVSINTNEKLFEFIIPIFPQGWLNKDRVDFYKKQIESNKTPTAISLSILDVKAPVYFEDEENPEILGHFCLSHYILDGHHKIFAATELQKPINLICFLATKQGICTENDITNLIHCIEKDK